MEVERLWSLEPPPADIEATKETVTEERNFVSSSGAERGGNPVSPEGYLDICLPITHSKPNPRPITPEDPSKCLLKSSLV